MSVFVDTSAWYAAADRGDRSHDRAKEVLGAGEPLLTSDHVLLETWLLLRARLGYRAAQRFWDGLRAGAAHVEAVVEGDLERAWAIGADWADQELSITDRTSFALMLRLGVHRVASFDDDFAVFRFGPRRRRAFEVLR